MMAPPLFDCLNSEPRYLRYHRYGEGERNPVSLF